MEIPAISPLRTKNDARIMHPGPLVTFIQGRPDKVIGNGCQAPFNNMYFGHSGKVAAIIGFIYWAPIPSRV
jgi:hypothetical protein